MDIENLERRHDRLQMWMLIGITVGSLGFAGQELIQLLKGPKAAELGLAVLTLVGWLIGAAAILSSSSLRKERGIENLLGDERLANLRGEAFQFGFVALLITQVVLLVGNEMLLRLTEVELTVAFAANLSIAVAVVSSLGRFVQLNHD
ncbi:MAG: hypothetical protein AAGA68_12875 [Pseudomonadota bacterium]